MGYFIYPIIHSLKINALFDNSNVFKGEIIEENDHCIQKGELKMGKKTYVGELIKYKPNGKGTLYKKIKNLEKNKIIYCGDFVAGKFEGNGILYYNHKKKTYYNGGFKDNQRHGYGKYYINNKIKYEGEFKDGRYDGKGTIYFKNGSYYTGEFANGKKTVGEYFIYFKKIH